MCFKIRFKPAQPSLTRDSWVFLSGAPPAPVSILPGHFTRIKLPVILSQREFSDAQSFSCRLF
jgi:hypothetical protein